MSPRVATTLFALSALACGKPDVAARMSPAATSASLVRAGGGGNTTYVAVDILATVDGGAPVTCDPAAITATVRVSRDGGQRWSTSSPASVSVDCANDRPPALGVVIDNSGSQEEIEQPTREGVRELIDGLRGLGGRASLVRVSTFSEVFSDLTDDLDAVAARLPDLEVNGGWTALYDGLRMANETLGHALSRPDNAPAGDLATWCADYQPRAMVTFTNGEDNNSAEQRRSGPEGDGYDTTMDDVLGLNIDGVATPVHVLGVGPRVDASGLTHLAEASGGRSIIAPDTTYIPSAFQMVRQWLDSSARVCAEVPQRGCGPALVEVSWSWQTAAGTLTGTKTTEVNVACAIGQPAGAVATMLLTLSDPEIPAGVAGDLAEDAARWVSPVDAPRVLVVRDDNHHGEDMTDTSTIAGWLAARGMDVTYLDEPRDGLHESDVAAFDVVWFSNPGWPMDDLQSFETLRRASAAGRGVVLQGDDMSWSMGGAFSLAPLTHLQHRNNGTSACGVRTDNRQAERYGVDLSVSPHPVVQRVAGAAFPYGNDIDDSAPMDEGEVVLGWADLDRAGCDARRPVVVGWEP